MQFPEFREFKTRGAGDADPNGHHPTLVVDVAPITHSPLEIIEEAAVQLRTAIAAELLMTLKAVRPVFFEQLVLDLLVKLGYGGSRQAVQHVGRSGDGGIDGIIDEDRLGLDAVYVQAKRWDGTVGRPVVQGFAGALLGAGARKGVFMTTGTFSKDAQIFAAHQHIALIDGPRLAELMIETGLGVSVEATYSVYRLDSDYFDPDPLAP